jgi:2-polyprenyl-3-methyl-5-hydroxy-6-metoxy-1,4-benzoquinol methylase
MTQPLSENTTSICVQCGHHGLQQVARFEDYIALAKTAKDERARMFAYYAEARDEVRFERFLACPNCTLTQLDPMPTEALLTEFYQFYYANQGYAQKQEKKIRRTRSRLKRLKSFISQGRFLDIGCNVGYAVEAARLEGFDATGIEIDADSVRYACEHFPHNRYHVSKIADFTPDKAFDLVHTTEVIEHVPDPQSFVRHLARLVTPGGYLYLTTPDAGHFRRPGHFVEWKEVKPPEHVIWQTKKSLRIALTQHGFTDLRFFLNMKPGIRLLAKKSG